MENQFTRTEMMLGEEAVARLRSARVAVFGVGGVGGYTVEALARAGVGELQIGRASCRERVYWPV